MTHLAIANVAAFQHGLVIIIITALPDAMLRSPAAVRKRANVCILYLSQNIQRLFHCTLLTGWVCDKVVCLLCGTNGMFM
jgi:hypothetical protein